jgi:hypothetical protein
VNPPKKIEIRVTLDTEKNQVIINGPIFLKLICIKILSTAIQIVVDDRTPMPKVAPVANGNHIIPQG